MKVKLIKEMIYGLMTYAVLANSVFAQESTFLCSNSENEVFLQGIYNDLTQRVEKLLIFDQEAVEVIKNADSKSAGKTNSKDRSYMFETHVPFHSQYGAVPPYSKFLGRWNTNKYSNNVEVKDRVVNIYVNSKNIFSEQFRLVFEIVSEEEYTYQSSGWPDIGDDSLRTYTGIKENQIIARGLECVAL